MGKRSLRSLPVHGPGLWAQTPRTRSSAGFRRSFRVPISCFPASSFSIFSASFASSRFTFAGRGDGFDSRVDAAYFYDERVINWKNKRVSQAIDEKRGPGRPRDEGLTARRRAQILDAATGVFAARGYRQADVQEMADALGIAKGTIYRYFPSKEALFLAAVDLGMRRLSERVRAEADAAGDSLGQVRRGVCAYLAFFDENPDLAELLIQERAEFKGRRKPTYFVHSEANVGRWHELMRRLIEEGRVRDVPAERINNVISDLLYGTMFTNLFARRRQSFESQARDILDVVFHGILTPNERRRQKNRNTA